ncbi:MAG TPA: fluoride efflux transporter CrcB [Gaiellales bacterium]|jgi:CrcB protein|nr:fluoride efflux transporter CrcB [Gaiellales bacterium]
MSVAGYAWPLIGVAAVAGALGRYLLDGAVERRLHSRFPFGTCTVNLSGAAALGLLHGAGAGGTLALVAGTAGLGTFTTFSTLIYETERLLEEGDRRLAAANILGSMTLGLAAVAAGWWIGRGL